MSNRVHPNGGISRASLTSPFPPNSPQDVYRRTRQPSSSSQLSLSTDNTRRPSSAYQRNNSQASISGPSAPGEQAYPRKRRDGRGFASVPEGETDWSSLDPDEVFRRLPVGEVKKVEGKMRAEAANKQSELRSMVGTRYRDLLTSATQITALRNSSIKLSESLHSAVNACSTSADLGTTAASETSEGEEVLSLLPVAAHMKLLLDAPEALYSFLAHHAFLKAAFLWLVTRVVKESLSGMDDDTNRAYLPLLQKQWDTLVPFRSQIVSHAQAALRSREPLDPRNLSETLLAIVLLDNLSVPDALSLLLNQRSKALREILNPAESSSQPHRRRDSRASTRSISKERGEISSVLAEAVKSVLETVSLARAVFEKAKRRDGESLLEELERLIQIGEPAPAASRKNQDLTQRRTSQERRASRLASISIAVPAIPSSLTGPPISSGQVLQTLPSAQILLRHLPTSITGFTPFIAPSSATPLDERLSEWQKSSIALLREAVPELLSALHSVEDVWNLRHDLDALLKDGELEADIKKALEEEWGRRIEVVWENKLGTLIDLVEVRTRETGEEIRSKGGETDTNPESFIFSEMPFPSAPTHALTATSTSLNTFVASVQKRAALRTPLLDSVLVDLETFAKDLRADMQTLPTSLYVKYGVQAEKALEKLVKTLGRVLESMGPQRGDGKGEAVDAEMFVGRVALYLAKQSDFLSDLGGEASIQLSSTQDALIRLHGTSVVRWREKATEKAITLLSPMFHPLLGPKHIQASWQSPTPTSVSSPVMVALHSMVQATRHLGLPPRTDLPLVRDFIHGFVDRARSMEGWEQATEEATAQAAFDLAFLGLLVGEEVGKDATVQKLLAKIPATVPAEFKTQLDQLLTDQLRRSQLLLSPLIRHLKPAAHTSISSSDLRNGLLRFGAPKGPAGGVGTEFKSPLAVAKPSKRFGLLSIAA